MTKIDHIAILVDNVPRAVKWYLQNYDCKVKYKDDTWILLEFDNINLAVISNRQNIHPPHIAVIDENLKKNDPAVIEHRDGSMGKYEHDGYGNFIERIKYKK